MSTPSAAPPAPGTVINPTWQAAMSKSRALFEKKNKRPPTDVEMQAMEESQGMPAKFAAYDAVKNATPEQMQQSTAAGYAAAGAAPPVRKGGKTAGYTGTGPGGKSLLWPDAGSPPAQSAAAGAPPPTPAAPPPAGAPIAAPPVPATAENPLVASVGAAVGQTLAGPAAPQISPAVGQALASAAPPPAPKAPSVSMDPALWTPQVIARAQDRTGDPRAAAYRQQQADRANPYAARSNNPTLTVTRPGQAPAPTAAPRQAIASTPPSAGAAPSAPPMPTVAQRMAAMDKQYPAIAAASTNSKVPDAPTPFGPQTPTPGQTRATMAAIDQKFRPDQRSPYAPATIQAAKPAWMTPTPANAEQQRRSDIVGGTVVNNLNGPTNALPGSTLPMTGGSPPPAAPALTAAPPQAPPQAPGFFQQIGSNIASNFGGSALGQEAQSAAAEVKRIGAGASVVNSGIKALAAPLVKAATAAPQAVGRAIASSPGFKDSVLEKKIKSSAPPPPPRSLVLR